MAKVSATDFKNQVGRYIDAAQHAPVTITSHGRDKVVLVSAELYRRLAGPGPSPGSSLSPPLAELLLTRPRRLHDPLTAALSLVNTSTPKAINTRALRDAVLNPKTKYRAQARLLINEADETVLAGLVAKKFVRWIDLAELAQRIGSDRREKTDFIRRMAGLPVA